MGHTGMDIIRRWWSGLSSSCLPSTERTFLADSQKYTSVTGILCNSYAAAADAIPPPSFHTHTHTHTHLLQASSALLQTVHESFL